MKGDFTFCVEFTREELIALRCAVDLARDLMRRRRGYLPTGAIEIRHLHSAARKLRAAFLRAAFLRATEAA